MGRFVGIVGKIIEHLPVAISTVERFLGRGNGASKRLAVGREVLEFVAELVRDDPTSKWTELTEVDQASLLAALADEKEFVSKISDVNDAIVSLVNYVNSKSE